ncbi:MAG: ABC transporter permease [Nitritalea sp.]
MNMFKLSWKYLVAKPLHTTLNIVLLAMGLAIITVLLLVQDQFEGKMTRDAKGIDLVVGAKGSPLQLILSSIYHIDFPTGNIDLEEAQKLTQNRLVKQVIPLGLGDNYQGYRIVGTNYDYLALYEAEVEEGKRWEKPFEIVLGAAVAAQTGLKIGDQIIGSHGVGGGGHAHDEHPYTVVGILSVQKNVLDQLILTSMESVWYTHDEEEEGQGHVHASKFDAPVATTGFPDPQGEFREVTAVLVQYRNPMAAVQLPRMINSRTNMQAASPAFEVARLFELLGVGVSLVQGIAVIIVVIAGLGIFIALYNSLKERKYDLAIMRTLGATGGQLFLHILLEGLILTFLGALVGLGLGHAFLALVINQVDQGAVNSLSAGVFLFEELYILGYALGVGVLAAIVPALAAYRTDIAGQLTRS